MAKLIAGFLVCVSVLQADLFIDFSTEYGPPASTMGGAAGVQGFWNGISISNFNGPVSLLDTDGNPSGAVYTGDFATVTKAFGFTPTPETTLLGDGHGATYNSDWSFTISGLAPGAYDVFYYGGGYDATGNMSINGINAPNAPGNPNWPGSWISGVNYNSLFGVTVDGSGILSFVHPAFTPQNPSGIGGIQVLEAVPEPSTLLTGCLSMVLFLLWRGSRSQVEAPSHAC